MHDRLAPSTRMPALVKPVCRTPLLPATPHAAADMRKLHVARLVLSEGTSVYAASGLHLLKV